MVQECNAMAYIKLYIIYTDIYIFCLFAGSRSTKEELLTSSSKNKKRATGTSAKTARKKPKVEATADKRRADSPKEEAKKDKKARKKEKKKKSKKSKKRVSSSSSSSCSSSDSSESSDSSTSSSSSADDSSLDMSDRKRKKLMAELELKEQLWHKEDRPEAFKSKKRIMRMSMAKFLKIKEQVNKERERQGLGGEVYVKDAKPKTKKFEEKKDNGETKLHPARFLPLPFAGMATWWRHVPTAHQEVYRHLPLAAIGIEGVAETIIVRMHNRKLPVELKSLCSDMKDLRQVQMAVNTFAMVQRYLHTADLSGSIILLVLTEAGWGEAVTDNDKQRIAIIEKFFDECTKENSHRAVHRDPPMDYEKTKARWVKAVAAICPHFGLAAVGQQLAAMSTGKGTLARSAGSGGASRGSGGGQGNGSGGQVGIKAKSSFDGRPPPRFQGLAVCYGFNNKEGCRRLAPGTVAPKCQDGNIVFAHMCNYYLKDKKEYCLQSHPRFGNH